MKPCSEEGCLACAGDLSQPQLGLKQDIYDGLCTDLDTIVHNGALVNHAYSYEQLFEPNVLGSMEVVRVATARRIKAMTFISSVGVVGGLNHPHPVLESEDGPALCDVHPGDGGYAIGCALLLLMCCIQDAMSRLESSDEVLLRCAGGRLG